jgi:mannose-6-phosphate isomerase-like protein (cupin superfamily)
MIPYLVVATRAVALAAALMAALPSAAQAAGAPAVRTVPPAAASVAADRDAATILADYASAWRGRKAMRSFDRPVVFGFSVNGGGDFQMRLPVEGAAELQPGLPEETSDWVATFALDLETLRRLDRGELNAPTAMAQAQGSDATPLTPRVSPEWAPQLRSFVLPLMFHFWTRDWPQVVRFGDGTTRNLHGANGTVLYYQQGLRTAWFQLEPGMRANEKAQDQRNPFDSLLIVTRGRAQAKLDGVDRTLHEGEAVFIPAGMAHQFWAGDDDYSESVLLMFGDGA